MPEYALTLPLRSDYRLTDGAAQELAQLCDGAKVYIGHPDSGLRSSDEEVGHVVVVTPDGTRVVGTVELPAPPADIGAGLDEGRLGFGMDATGVAERQEDGTVLIQSLTALRGINIVPVADAPVTTILEGTDPLELT